MFTFFRRFRGNDHHTFPGRNKYVVRSSSQNRVTFLGNVTFSVSKYKFFKLGKKGSFPFSLKRFFFLSFPCNISLHRFVWVTFQRIDKQILRRFAMLGCTSRVTWLTLLALHASTFRPINCVCGTFASITFLASQLCNLLMNGYEPIFISCIFPFQL